MFERVKDYKSACKVLGIKPIDKRRKLEEHVLVYIQLSTITQAINFIANNGYQSMNKINLSEHGTVGGTLIGTKLKKVLLRVSSLWVLTVVLALPVVIWVLIYDLLTEMQQNMQLKHLDHYI